MSDKLTSATVVCQGGLYTTENYLDMDQNAPGAGVNLVNYEVGLYGGYRRINGYIPYSEDYEFVDDAGAEGSILGLAIYTSSDGVQEIITARKQQGSSTYKFYIFQDGVGWAAVSPGFTLDSNFVFRIRHHKFTVASTNYIIFVDGTNYATVYDGTNWYQLKSTNTGASSASPGGNQILNAPSYVTGFKNHIFLSGDKNYPGVICHSAPLSFYDWTVASGAGQLVAGYSVVAIKPFRDVLYVWGTTDISNITVSGANFVINQTATNIGCIAPDSVQEINGDLIYLAQDGIRTISGTDRIGDINLATISKPIQQYINDLQDAYDLSFLCSAVIKKKSQFRYYISQTFDGAEGSGLIGAIREVQGNTVWEYSKLSGIQANVVEVDYLPSNEEVILHGDNLGGIYRQEAGNSMNGAEIISVYKTPFLTFGDFSTRKKARKMYVFLRPEGPIDMSINYALDWNDPESLAPNTFGGSIGEDTSVYGDSESIYDSGTTIYVTGETRPFIELDVLSTWKSLQVSFTSSTTSTSHSIQGFVIELTPEGKR